jgi:shikimate kinase
MNSGSRIVLTGFMGVGKSTVAKCLSYLLQTEKIDLDRYIEEKENLTVPEIIENKGIEYFRRLETDSLKNILAGTDLRIIALGGGAWMTEQNRQIIKNHKCVSVWLESTFEHCWRNISCSKQERPLAKDRKFVQKLFDERQKIYCLADWHFVVRPELTSFDIAKSIAEEVLC